MTSRLAYIGDPHGVLWATESGTPSKLRRVSGSEVRVVEAPLGVRPHFAGGFVWVDSLRVDEPTWEGM